jgi:hypothetical protein
MHCHGRTIQALAQKLQKDCRKLYLVKVRVCNESATVTNFASKNYHRFNLMDKMHGKRLKKSQLLVMA